MKRLNKVPTVHGRSLSLSTLERASTRRKQGSQICGNFPWAKYNSSRYRVPLCRNESGNLCSTCVHGRDQTNRMQGLSVETVESGGLEQADLDRVGSTPADRELG